MTCTYREYWLGSCKHVDTNSLHAIVSDRNAAVRSIKNLGMGTIPCLYLLIDTMILELYVGQTGNASRRIAEQCSPRSHGGSPRRFNKVVIIWDGRPIQITRFNDEAVRKGIEARLIRAFSTDGKFSLTNKMPSGSETTLDQAEQVEAFGSEALFALQGLRYLGGSTAAAAGGGRQSWRQRGSRAARAARLWGGAPQGAVERVSARGHAYDVAGNR